MKLIISIFFFVLAGLLGVSGDCIWYGIGGYSFRNTPLYSAYNGPGKPLNDSAAYEALSRLCPEYALAPDTPLCCDKAQMEFFAESLKQAYALLRRCPACWKNFRSTMCGMTCGPNQAEFVTADQISPDNLVQSITFDLTLKVADTLFNSCKDVQFSGGHSVDFICGTTTCTTQRFLTGLGGDQSPFPVHFVTHNDSRTVTGSTKKPFDRQFFFCNQTVPERKLDRGGAACSCTDCEDSCLPPLPPPTPKPKPTVLGLDAWWVGASIALVILVICFAAYEITIRVFCRYRKRSPSVVVMGGPTVASANLPMGQPNCLTRLQASLESVMYKTFYYIGQTVARHPYLTLLISVIASGILCIGLVHFHVTTNPVELWSAPSSRSRLEKNYYDNNFGPFYRTEQIVFRPVDQTNFTHNVLRPSIGTTEFGPALRKEFLKEVLKFQNELRDMTFYSTEFERNISLSDICFKPLAPDNLMCAITSPLEYFQSDLKTLNYEDLAGGDYIDHLMNCAQAPMSIKVKYPTNAGSCLAASGMPIQPNVVFGGYDGTFYNGSRVITITFLVNNNPDPRSEQVRMSEVWELEFLNRVQNWSLENSHLAVISYLAERSVEDEINRQSEADVSIVFISYLLMFIYVSIFLASYHSCRTVLVDLRVTLGIGGILIVIVSILASVGILSYVGTPATLIIIEVIPFLVLAVGVDNIFIMVQEYEFDEMDANKLLTREAQRMGNNAQSQSSMRTIGDDAMTPTIKGLVEARMARTMGRIGPSLLLSSITETVAFLCGSLTSMPAVRAFALYAGVAIAINLLLQLSAFLALMTLDARRRATQRFDVLCCFGLHDKTRDHATETTTGSQEGSTRGDQSRSSNGTNNGQADSLSLESNAWDELELTNQTAGNKMSHESNATPWLHRCIANGLTPFLLSGWIRPLVIVISLAWACFAIAIVPNGLHVGLDQRLAMPTDSYVLDYFNTMSDDLRLGVPVYFVVTNGHRYNVTVGQNEVCGSFGCPVTSLTGRLNEASRSSTYTRIGLPASSWIDDYFDWVDPEGSSMCCRVYANNTRKFCPDDAPAKECITCPVRMVDGRPIEEDFNFYLPRFLDQNPTSNCPRGGRAAHHSAVDVSGNNQVGATSFMTYHTVLTQPDDFLDALRQARALADEISQDWRLNNSMAQTDDGSIPPMNSVFPYSVFYVYYEQYLTVVDEALYQVGICLLAIIGVTFLLLGLNLIATLMVMLGVFYILLSMLALMVLWGIDLNALSLVNLVVTVGIAVEFCAHIVRSFVISVEPTRLSRAKAALTAMGSSILRGITLTNLGGIIVLAFSKSRLFQIFYFRMYLGISLFGAYTAVIFLPVVLSYIGPGLNKALARKHSERLRERDLFEHMQTQPTPNI